MCVCVCVCVCACAHVCVCVCVCVCVIQIQTQFFQLLHSSVVTAVVTTCILSVGGDVDYIELVIL